MKINHNLFLPSIICAMFLTSLHASEISPQIKTETTETQDLQGLNNSLIKLIENQRNRPTVDQVQTLIDKGASIETVNTNGSAQGRTILNLAAKNGLIAISSLFITKGANIHADDADDNPLMWLLWKSNSPEYATGIAPACSLLIDKGAQPFAKNKNGSSPLSLATVNNRADVCKVFIRSAIVEPIRKNSALAAYRKKFITILCTLKRVIPTKIQVDLIIKICALAGLEKELSYVLCDAHSKGVRLSPTYNTALKTKLPVVEEAHFSRIKQAMKEVWSNAKTVEMKKVLDPATLEAHLLELIFPPELPFQEVSHDETST